MLDYLIEQYKRLHVIFKRNESSHNCLREERLHSPLLLLADSWSDWGTDAFPFLTQRPSDLHRRLWWMISREWEKPEEKEKKTSRFSSCDSVCVTFGCAWLWKWNWTSGYNWMPKCEISECCDVLFSREVEWNGRED